MNTIQQLEQNEVNHQIAKILYNRTPLFKFSLYFYAVAEGVTLIMVAIFMSLILGVKEDFVEIYTMFFTSLVGLVVIFIAIEAMVETKLYQISFDNEKFKEALFKIKQENLYEQFISSKTFEKIVNPSKPITYGDVAQVYFEIGVEKKKLKQKIFQQEQDKYESLLAESQREYIQKYWKE